VQKTCQTAKEGGCKQGPACGGGARGKGGRASRADPCMGRLGANFKCGRILEKLSGFTMDKVVFFEKRTATPAGDQPTGSAGSSKRVSVASPLRVWGP
jgi:hypothetical protein